MYCWFQRTVLRDWWVSILEWQCTICIQPIIQLCRVDNFNNIVKICKSRNKSMAALNFQKYVLSSSNKRRIQSKDCGTHTDSGVPPCAYLQAVTYMPMLSLPDLGNTSNWLNRFSIMSNQKHYPDLVSDTSSVWNFCARCSDVISRGKFKVVMSRNVDCFLKLQ